MTRYLTLGVLLIFALYGLAEGWPLLSGPALSVASPQNGASATSSVFMISGRARRTVALTLDGAPLLPDQSGAFSTTLTLPRGGAILTFVARDRFGRTVTATRTVFVP